MSKDRHFELTVGYNTKHVPRDVDEAIRKLMRDAARQVVAKVALLSSPSVVVVEATTWEDDRYKDLLFDESHLDSP